MNEYDQKQAEWTARFEAFKSLPKAQYDCWQNHEIVLPAQHDLDDFKAALELQRENTDISLCGHFLDADDLKKVWKRFAGDGTYIRPDVLTFAVARRLNEVIDGWIYDTMIGDDYREEINEAKNLIEKQEAKNETV